MKQILFPLVIVVSVAATSLAAPEPTPTPKSSSVTSEKRSSPPAISKDLAHSANGWRFDKGEWIHPDGYKYVNGKVLRTTARLGQRMPKPPGRLALDNPEKLPPSATVVEMKASSKSADKASQKERNMAPRPAPQTGSHL